jgi:di- and tripeptidase
MGMFESPLYEDNHLYQRPCRHYDVMAAPARDWQTDPFNLTGRNGYLYGRGATDNKGPITAVACAVAELLRRRLLNVDLVMLIEGEEESGSVGFREAVQKNKVRDTYTPVRPR